MNELNFNWRYKNYELRACPRRLVKFSDDDINETIDFVKWDKHSDGKEYCYSLAFWKRDNEGYDLYFVGDRMFTEVDKDDIEIVWDQLHAAQTVLDIFWESNYKIDRSYD